MDKQTRTILITILIIIIVIVGAYLLLKKPGLNKSSEYQNLLNNDINSLKNKNIKPNENWNELSEKELIQIVSSGAPDLYFNKDEGLTISDKIDLTGDGSTEAIVNGIGYNSGVTFILIKNNDGSIKVAKQKYEDNISPVYLVSVGRAMISEEFKLIPEDNGFYTVSLSLKNENNNQESSNFKCNILNAYSWNKQIGLFEYNESLTQKYKKEVCK